MEHAPPQFFNRGPAPVARITFFALASILLMVLDARLHYAEPLRQAIGVALYPIQRVAIAPVAAVSRTLEFFSTQSQLLRDNAEMRAGRLRDAEALLTLESLRAENRRLRQLVDAKEKTASEAIFAEIVYAGRDPFSRKVVLDKGSQQGVKLGQPVIDATGVLGQVTRVQPLLAEVTLITDKDHPIPVQVVRNGLRGVAFGAGDGSTMELRHMATNAEIEPGDLLVTSGLDGVYPRGLPVARVAKIERDAAFAFAKISCEPVAGANPHPQVLVLGKVDEAPAWAAENPGAKKSAKVKRSRRLE
jgi:rod shape-determining protein MreC